MFVVGKGFNNKPPTAPGIIKLNGGVNRFDMDNLLGLIFQRVVGVTKCSMVPLCPRDVKVEELCG